ncbi:hypothetical protein H8959_005624, partial [Pygathrix nigripes]
MKIEEELRHQQMVMMGQFYSLRPCGRTFEDITRAFEGQAHGADRSGKDGVMEMNSIQPPKETTTN